MSVVMRRYRFVEDGMMIGLPETSTVVKQARQNIKLWNRVDVENGNVQDVKRYNHLIARRPVNTVNIARLMVPILRLLLVGYCYVTGVRSCGVRTLSLSLIGLRMCSRRSRT
jgi:hypothetical protein